MKPHVDKLADSLQVASLQSRDGPKSDDLVARQKATKAGWRTLTHVIDCIRVFFSNPLEEAYSVLSQRPALEGNCAIERRALFPSPSYTSIGSILYVAQLSRML